MRKKFATIISFLAVSMLLIACGNSNNTNKGDSGENSSILKVAYPSWWEDWFKDVKEDFEEQNEGIEVELIPLYDDTTTKQDMMMQSAETAPDVAVEDTYILNSDVNAGYLSSMQRMVDNWEDWNNIEDTVKEGVTSEDGEIYGVPFSTDVQGLWYNRELFKEAGLSEDFQPEAWEDVLDAARKLKDSNENTIPLFIYSTKSNEEATSMRTFQMLYSGTGSELYDLEKEKWIVDEKALTDTFDFIYTVYQEELGPSLSFVSDSQVATLLAEETMRNNDVAMVMDGNWVAGNWRSGDDEEAYDNAMDIWGFIPFPTQNGQEPGYTSMSGGWAFSIPEKAQNKELAEEFIKMAVDQEHQLKYVLQTGDMTVRSDVAESEDYLNQPISNYEEANEILEYTNFRPTVDDYPTVSTHIQEVVEGIASGNYNSEKTVQEYEEGLARIVGEENVMNR